MGDPKKLTNKYSSPRKVWDADRIKTEGKLKTDYGLKKTREIWVTLSDLKRARRGAMKMLAAGATGMEKAKPLISRLVRLGIISADAKLDDVLSLTVENFLDRRLQSRVMKKGLARTAKQARQLITHGFISVKGRKVTIPSYIVTAAEEEYVAYYKPIDISVHEHSAKQNASDMAQERHADEEDKSKKLAPQKAGAPSEEKAAEAPKGAAGSAEKTPTAASEEAAS